MTTVSKIPFPPLEEDCLHLFCRIINAMTKGQIKRIDFLNLMNDMRIMVMRLENTKHGCATGVHAGPCTCKVIRGETKYSTNRKEHHEKEQDHYRV